MKEKVQKKDTRVGVFLIRQNLADVRVYAMLRSNMGEGLQALNRIHAVKRPEPTRSAARVQRGATAGSKFYSTPFAFVSTQTL